MIRVLQRVITEEMATCTQKTLLLDKNKQINASNVGRQRCHPCGQNFSLRLLKVHTEINALSRPKGSRWTPPVERGWPSSLPPPHNTVLCERHSAPFVLTCFLLPTSFLFLLKIFWRAMHLSIGSWFFQWIATGTNRIRPGRPSHGSYASTKILNLHLSALGKIDQP